MTFLALNLPESCLSMAESSTRDDISSICKVSPSIPRINLRKRTVSGDSGAMIVSSVNSAFLSGLFADVARVQDESPPPPPASESTSREEGETMVPPSKKSRLSLNKSISRCAKSFKSIADALLSPTGVVDNALYSFDREDSLHYQLCCVSDKDGVQTTESLRDVAKLAFPQLPATISNSSCSSLTRKLSDLQSSIAENIQKESYGWFVDMDNEEEADTHDYTDPYAASKKDLAFSAPTAPKASDYDAEVEWAQAADTVDDVLGDFF
jgi:hypothetical protein